MGAGLPSRAPAERAVVHERDLYHALALLILSGMGMEGRATTLLNICRS